jgi:hypothetical protein
MFYPTIVSKAEQYILTCDPAALEDMIEAIQAEKDNPSVQAAMLRVPMAAADFDRASGASGFIKLSVESIDSDKPVVEDKLIRVFCADAGEVPTHICMVAHLDEAFIKLIPAMGVGEAQQ